MVVISADTVVVCIGTKCDRQCQIIITETVIFCVSDKKPSKEGDVSEENLEKNLIKSRKN